eukprot:16445079-Heterocapsa_arctica.AAC.1
MVVGAVQVDQGEERRDFSSNSSLTKASLSLPPNFHICVAIPFVGALSASTFVCSRVCSFVA